MDQAVFHAINPATGAALEPAMKQARAEDVARAAASARQAFEQSRGFPLRWSADLLDKIAEQIMALGDALLDKGEAETALPRPRLMGERARTVAQIKMFAAIVREGSWVDAAIDTADPNRTPAPRPDIRRMLVPRGPVAIFGASNFPFAFGTVGGDTASALAAGCPVVVKGHPSHPGTSELFAKAVSAAIEQLRLPAGLFSLIQGTSNDLGAALVRHPEICAVGFTGSLRAGRALFDLAAGRKAPIPVFAEMGSTNPLFILPGALADRADKIATGLAGSVLLGVGQFCTKPGLIFTIGDDGPFISMLAERLRSQAGGTMLNQNLRQAFLKQLDQISASAGVSALAKSSPSGHAAISPALFHADATNWKHQSSLHEEAFGPAAIVVQCRSIDEALSCIDHLEGSLTGTLHADDSDQDQARKLLDRLEEKVGRVIVNGYPTGVEVNNAIVHGGPYPATTDPGFTSVGASAITRWVRPIAFQDFPDVLLPPALQNANPLKIERTINGMRSRGSCVG